MTDKELKRLSRSELLEMLIEQMEENEELRKKLEKAQAALRSKRIAIKQAGSIAEAALKLNGIFEAADRAAKQYVANVRLLAEAECGGDKPETETPASEQVPEESAADAGAAEGC